MSDGLVRFDAESRSTYRNHGWWTGRTLTEELVRAGLCHADEPALTTPEIKWSYADLFAEATRFGAGLVARLGVQVGDPVMFQMGNTAETIVAYLGCLLAGARPVCTLPQHGNREVTLLAKHTGAQVLLAQADFGGGQLVDQARLLLESGAIAQVVLARGEVFPGAVGFEDIRESGDLVDGASMPYATLDPNDIAVFQLSGGTTGLPKVAPRLHEEYAYNSLAWAQAMEYCTGRRLLYPLPVMHNAGISLAVQPAILSGAELVLAPSAEVEGLVALVERHRPDTLPLVPPALAIRLLESPAAHAADLTCIRDFVVGGQRLAVDVAERLRDELGIRVRQMFGMAEGMFLVTPAVASEAVRHHTVGSPISPGDEIRILSPVSEESVPDGEVGEFAARGPYTIRGYYRAEEHNRAAFTSDGFYRTGDLARRHITEEGVFYSIEGRIKDVINRGAEKIHAEEVEELIARHEAVRTAALVAMPDELLGERGCAYLVLEPDAPPVDVAGLGEHLRGLGLAKYKLPERVEIVSSLPLTNVGKVAKSALREDIGRKLAEEQEAGA